VNAVGQYFQVRQRHAHAWVEAYLEPDQVPQGVLSIRPLSQPTGGAWIRLDPTPGIEEDSPLRAGLDDVLDYAQLLWSDFVLDHDSEGDGATSPLTAPAMSRMLPFERWSQGARSWASAAFDRIREWLGEDGFGWRAGLLTAALLGLAAGTVRGAVWLWQHVPWNRSARRRRSRSTAVPFYLRLERLLRRSGLDRSPLQTPREFAEQVAEQFAETPGLAPVAAIPVEVAGAYYRVRFGGAVLDSDERQRLEQALRLLEQALGGRRRRPPRPRPDAAGRRNS
jgi:hypothetical protein